MGMKFLREMLESRSALCMLHHVPTCGPRSCQSPVFLSTAPSLFPRSQMSEAYCISNKGYSGVSGLLLSLLHHSMNNYIFLSLWTLCLKNPQNTDLPRNLIVWVQPFSTQRDGFIMTLKFYFRFIDCPYPHPQFFR